MSEFKYSLYLGERIYAVNLIELIMPNLQAEANEHSVREKFVATSYPYDIAILDAKWYLALATSSELPHKFSGEKIFLLPEEERFMLGSVVGYHFSGRQWIESLELKAPEGPRYSLFGHPNYLHNIAMGRIMLNTGRQAQIGMNGQYYSDNGRNFHVNGLHTILEAIIIPENLAMRARELYKRMNSDIGMRNLEICREKLKIETEATNYFVKERLEPKLV